MPGRVELGVTETPTETQCIRKVNESRPVDNVAV